MRIIILGACGSIGRQTLDIMEENNVELVGCSMGHDLSLAKEIINRFHPQIVCLRKKEDINEFKGFKNLFCYGDEGLITLAQYEADLVVNALMGSVGLKPTVEAIKTKHDVALANKETLVMAGDIIKALAKEYNVNILPIDSEHSAIWQCLKGENIEDVKRLIITASGGSFRDKTREELDNVTVADALNHPNWSMGKKITIDSATMMNKGLEVIEAHHLFDIPYEKIETIMHKESIIHSMVEFKDSSIKAQMATADMRMPILYALFKGKRVTYKNELKLTTMHFEELSEDRFPCLRYAYEAGKKGGMAPVVLNAANEAAVTLFLYGKIKFLDIEKIVYNELCNLKNFTPTLDEIIMWDKLIKDKILGGVL